MMKQLITDFTKHLEQAITIGSSAKFNASKNKIDNVLICGLGGSGIGGTIISQLISDECKKPILVNKDYTLPAFVSENSLVICCSYSGNTEETLSMFAQAEEKGAEIAIITSGGKFAEIAKEEVKNIIQIPGGLPPRAAFGLSFPQLFFVFEKYGLIQSKSKQIQSAINLITQEESNIQNEAIKLSEKLHGKLPVIYGESSLDGVCVRFRQQINENAKMLCWHHVIPEMNHNELVGWRTKNKDLAVVLFRSEADFYRNQERIEYSKEIIEKYASSINEVYTKGDSSIERALYLIHLGDWVSYFLAEKKQIDAVEVDVITGLKEMLVELD
ncbi:MAG: bifunctional phosphoglucose/phosphomannose isomerase [Flavobacteriales bacterium]|nr:bifunctional phosphoglucose/phosphomannose isomerase [Flavobacteriales bacterium]